MLLMEHYSPLQNLSFNPYFYDGSEYTRGLTSWCHQTRLTSWISQLVKITPAALLTNGYALASTQQMDLGVKYIGSSLFIHYSILFLIHLALGPPWCAIINQQVFQLENPW